jgi:hypothetical protein
MLAARRYGKTGDRWLFPPGSETGVKLTTEAPSLNPMFRKRGA